MLTFKDDIAPSGTPTEEIASVIFDLDGTFTDTKQLYLEAKVATIQSFGVKVTPQIQELLAGGLSDKEIVLQVGQLTGKHIPIDEYRDVYVAKTTELIRISKICSCSC